MSEAEKQPRVRSSCGVNNVMEYVFPLDFSSILGACFLRGIIKAVFDHLKKKMTQNEIHLIEVHSVFKSGIRNVWRIIAFIE